MSYPKRDLIEWEDLLNVRLKEIEPLQKKLDILKAFEVTMAPFENNMFKCRVCGHNKFYRRVSEFYNKYDDTTYDVEDFYCGNCSVVFNNYKSFNCSDFLEKCEEIIAWTDDNAMWIFLKPQNNDVIVELDTGTLFNKKIEYVPYYKRLINWTEKAINDKMYYVKEAEEKISQLKASISASKKEE